MGAGQHPNADPRASTYTDHIPVLILNKIDVSKGSASAVETEFVGCKTTYPRGKVVVVTGIFFDCNDCLCSIPQSAASMPASAEMYVVEGNLQVTI